jgi:proteasome lid subunit RPN8/RPN11
MNERIRFGQPIEPPVYTAELPCDLSTRSSYNIGSISQNDPFQVYLLRPVWETILNHVRSTQRLECSGVLVGLPLKTGNGSVTFVVIIGSVPHGTDQRSIGHVTVGPQEIAKTREILERDYASFIPVGWYHSHPGHGIFLSPQDMVIVRSLYNLQWHVALVVDPIHNTAGIFQGSDAKRLPGWQLLNDTEKINWKEWALNAQKNGSLPPVVPSNSQVTQPQHVVTPARVPDAESAVASTALEKEELLDANIATDVFQRAIACLKNGDEVGASQNIYTLLRKHPDFRPDEVRGLETELNKFSTERSLLPSPAAARQQPQPPPPPRSNAPTDNVKTEPPANHTAKPLDDSQSNKK